MEPTAGVLRADDDPAYRFLLDNMLNGFAYCRMVFEEGIPQDFIYLYVNPSFEKQTGLKDVVGRRVSEVVPGIREQDPELFERYGRVVLSGQPEQFELFVQALAMWFDVSVYSPTAEHFVAVFNVITERKRMEQILREESDRRRTLFEHSRDGLCVIGTDGRVMEVNARFADMLGYTPEEMRHLYIWDWDVQWGREEVLSAIHELGYHGRTLVTRHRRKDGTVYPVEVSTCKLAWQGCEMILASHREITQQLQQQAQLRQVVKMEALGTLAGGIAHDFNNILSVILGYTELLFKQLPREGQSYRDLLEVYQAGLRARDLVAQLLAFSRQTEGEIRPMLLDPLLKEVVKFLRVVASNDMEINLHIKSSAAWVMADPSQIHQILMNLCTNAIQAMEGRAGCLTVTLEEVALDLQTADALHLSPGGYILLVVGDSGPGIPLEIQSRIFDPFFTSKAIGQGTGLGLSVVQGLVMAHGGAVEVESKPGEGARFRVYLRRISPAPPHPGA
ncbi:MAG: PAS domain S-box protein [Magnetococcus sp. MYC-9]